MTNWIPAPSGDNLTSIDGFCGIGGWTTAAGYVGIETKQALNHDEWAISVHHHNHPHTDHFLGDIRATKPSQHPRTPISTWSPACTEITDANNISTALNQSHQMCLFEDEERERERLVAEHQKRATMWDVIEFAAYHKYHMFAVENVVQVHRWPLFPMWCRDLRNLGYNLQMCYFNAMFFHNLNGVDKAPYAPQSRDRWFCVATRVGNKQPDLDFRPLAPCPICEKSVRARQVWKNAKKQWGKYNESYFYTCPNGCKNGKKPIQLTPYYYAGINGIDLNIPIKKIKNADRPISERTKARIMAGMEKYGWHPLMLNNFRDSDSQKYKSALIDPAFTATGTRTMSVALPPAFIINRRGGEENQDNRVKPISDAIPALTAGGVGVGVAILDLSYSHGNNDQNRVRDAGAEPCFTQTTSGTLGMFMVEMYGNGTVRDIADPVNTITAGGGKTGLCVNPIMTTYNGQHPVITTGADPLATVTTVERHGMSIPDDEIDIEEVYYRTLRSKYFVDGPDGTKVLKSELRKIQGFEDSYDLFGTTEQITRGIGNAIHPGTGYWIIKRMAEALEG